MKKTITVKGVGIASVKPDLIELIMQLSSKETEYNAAMEAEGERIQCLTEELCSIGFDKTDLKTTDYNVDTVNKNVKDENGNFHSIFDGFKVSHNLVLRFDYDQEKLSEVLSKISSSSANPSFSINFTVKDPNAVRQEMLRKAAENAREKAESLCQGAGTEIDKLLTIEYNWKEVTIESHTDVALYESSSAAIPYIEPDDINASDTATFVWELK